MDIKDLQNILKAKTKKQLIEERKEKEKKWKEEKERKKRNNETI